MYVREYTVKLPHTVPERTRVGNEYCGNGGEDMILSAVAYFLERKNK